MILGLYIDGDSVLHRLSAGTKLIVMILLTAMLMLPYPSVVLPIGTVFAVVGFALSGLGIKTLGTIVESVALWVILIFVITWWGQGIAAASYFVTRLIVAVLIASLVTLTTRSEDLMEAVIAGLRPFRRFGANPEAVGLAFALTMRSVPALVGHARTVKEAQLARGNRNRLSSFFTPLLVRTLRHADLLGEALVARGYEDYDDGDGDARAPRLGVKGNPRDP